MASRILVLDDEENYAAMLQELLREYKYRVDMATRPERAISLLEEIPYDLVISDYKMPVMDGADFLKRARELYPNLPFILVSGLMNTPELVKVANMSVTLVMEKPLDTASFLQHVSRFSEPMTDEERSAYVQQSERNNETQLTAVGLPEEPRFISAASNQSVRFMQELWAWAQSSEPCYLFEPLGGEADLALKDISAWMGNHDKPLQSFTMDELVGDGSISKLNAVAEDPESSQVVLVRLDSVEQIDAAKILAVQMLEKPMSLAVAFVVSSTGDDAEFVAATGSSGLVLPVLSERPADIANYICRFLRIASERMDKPKVAKLSADVVYALLAYSWSSYREIQEVVTQLIGDKQDVHLDDAAVCGRLNVAQMPAPSERLAALLSQSQTQYIQAQSRKNGVTVEEFTASLDGNFAVDSVESLSDMPLLDENLATL